MLADPTMDVDQEYLNKYTVGKASVWGMVEAESIQPIEMWEV